MHINKNTSIWLTFIKVKRNFSYFYWNSKNNNSIERGTYEQTDWQIGKEMAISTTASRKGWFGNWPFPCDRAGNSQDFPWSGVLLDNSFNSKPLVDNRNIVILLHCYQNLIKTYLNTSGWLAEITSFKLSQTIFFGSIRRSDESG